MARDQLGTSPSPTDSLAAATVGYVSQRTLSLNPTTQTASFIAAIGSAYNVDGSAGNVVVTLPASAPVGATCAFRKSDSNTAMANWIIFQPSGGDHILAVGQPQLRQGNDSYEFVSDGGGNWLPIPSLALGNSSPAAYMQMTRDGSGRSQVADPAVGADIATKNYVDTTRTRYAGAWSSTAGYSANDIVSYNGASYVCTAAVAAPAATSLVGTSAFYNASANGSQQALPSGTQAGDVLVIALGVLNTGGSITRVAAIAGATLISPALNYGNNNVFGYIYAYTVTATDVTNGYVTFANQTPNNAYGAVFHVFRNTNGNFNSSSGSNGAASTSFTPSAFPDFIYNATFCNLTAGNNGVATQANQTSVVNESQIGTMLIGAGYESVSSGATTSRTWTRTNANGTGATLAAAVGTTAGTPNTTPDVDTGHWTLLGGPPPGTVQMYAGAAAPTGYLLCDGSSVLRSSYPGLFAAIGTAYGSVDGTHFTLPDLRQRFPYGNNAASSTLGNSGGAATHTHPLSDAGQADMNLGGNPGVINIRRIASGSWTANINGTLTTAAGTASGAQTVGVGLVGNTDAASTLPPYQVLNFIIKI